LSFKNIHKVAINLGVSLSTLFQELEDKAKTNSLDLVEATPKLHTKPKKSATE
jgi:hypothetical protein